MNCDKLCQLVGSFSVGREGDRKAPASHRKSYEPGINNVTHAFGRFWTDQKLTILRKYLVAYTTALSKSQFKTGYIDAFAGTGYRERSTDAKRRDTDRFQENSEARQGSLLGVEDSTGPEGETAQAFLDGSARVALECEPAFDSYVFIERNRLRHRELTKLKDEFPHLRGRMVVKRGEANTEIQAMCGKKWGRHRAVLFLDPYGTEVRWKTIEAIAATKAIDLWVLFPLGAVHRMLTQSGDIPVEWRRCLDDLLGTTEWYERFYQKEVASPLFGDSNERFVKAHTGVICKYFLERLDECFAGVAQNPVILRNSKNFPLYLFCFAAGNPKGAPIALKIASHILKMGS